MPLSKTVKTALVSIMLLLFPLLMNLGCGVEQLQPVLPDAIAGFTLADLEEIQDDDRLTDTEKKQRIRDAVDAPDTDSGDRLVDFLFSLNVP